MISAVLGAGRTGVELNTRKTLTAIIYLAVIGPCVFILQPGFVQGLVEQLGLSEQQAGDVASAEMWGIAATTVLLIGLASRVSWRKATAVCVLLCGMGNLLSIGQTDVGTLAILRFITGLGSGGIISLTFTMAGLTERSDRNFGFIIVWVLTYGAAGLLMMPTAYGAIGMSGVLTFFALFCLSGLWFVRFLPDSGEAHADVVGQYDFSAFVRRLSLFAILIYNMAIGIVWAYLFLVGLEGGMAEQSVANVLTISQILGIGGALFAVLFEKRLGRLLPLGVGIIGAPRV